MNTCKVCWVVAIGLGLLSVTLLSRFVAVGTLEASVDGRVAIDVSPVERELVLEEMRGLLEAVQTIIVANNAGDLNTVAVAARKVGLTNMDPRSAEFVTKLPADFRKLGMDTHSRFDDLAIDSKTFESTEHVMQQLGELTGNCVACHRAYRLVANNTE